MMELDLFHLAPGALLLVFGWFLPMDGGVSDDFYAFILVLGVLLSLYTAWLSFRVVMSFADDLQMLEGLWRATVWFFRFGAAFWLWTALALAALSIRYADASQMLMRGCIISASIGGIVFVVGVAWFITYAVAKRNVHRSSKV